MDMQYPKRQASIIALFCLLMKSGLASAQTSNETWMRFAVHQNVTPIGLATLDQKFAAATQALKIDSGADDVACNLTLARSDSGWTFSGGSTTDVINTPSNLAGVQNNGSDAYVDIVNTINWCDAVGSFGGCGSPVGGLKPFVVTRNDLVTVVSGGNLIAHEFGHTVGLQHNPSAQQIMQATFTTSNNKLQSNSDCLLFRHTFQPSCPSKTNNSGPPGSAVCSPVTSLARVVEGVDVDDAASSREGGIIEHHTDFSEVPIELLARGTIVDRMPIEVEEYYGPEDVAILKAMLKDPSSEIHHKTILALVGLISDGADDDVRAIANYGGKETSGAMVALGSIANRTGSVLALDVLFERFSGENSRSVTAAALGLALSGDLEALRALQERSRSIVDADAGRDLLELVAESQLVIDFGFREYNRGELPRAPVDDNGPTGVAFPIEYPSDGTKEADSTQSSDGL